MNCSICLEQINKKEFKTICGHNFHHNCIINWLIENNNCPVCRKQLNTETSKPKTLRHYVKISNSFLNDISETVQIKLIQILLEIMDNNLNEEILAKNDTVEICASTKTKFTKNIYYIDIFNINNSVYYLDLHEHETIKINTRNLTNFKNKKIKKLNNNRFKSKSLKHSFRRFKSIFR